MKFSFEEIDKKNKIHIDSLFTLLEKRLFNISHINMPDYKSHFDFVMKNPYRKWNLIYKEKNLSGSYYLTFNNFIGINLLSRDIQDYKILIEQILIRETPLPEIRSIRNKNFLINTSPDNKNLINALKILKFQQIQTTYTCG